MSGGSARWALREATGEAHARLDAAFARFDLADPSRYRAFLRAHRRVLPALEAAVTGAGAGWSGWSPRAPALDADLAALGGSAGPPAGAPPDPLSAAEAWGVQYVLEGSRLGGRMIAAGLPAGAPRRYLADPQPPGAWPRFQEELDRAVGGDPAALADAQAGAHLAFARFQAVADDA